MLHVRHVTKSSTSSKCVIGPSPILGGRRNLKRTFLCRLYTSLTSTSKVNQDETNQRPQRDIEPLIGFGVALLCRLQAKLCKEVEELGRLPRLSSMNYLRAALLSTKLFSVLPQVKTTPAPCTTESTILYIYHIWTRGVETNITTRNPTIYLPATLPFVSVKQII